MDSLSDYFPAAVCCVIDFTILRCGKMILHHKGVFFMPNYTTSFSNDRIITRKNACRYIHTNTLIPSYVRGIASEAFQSKSMIKTIQFPAELSHIGARAFRNCNGLTDLRLPNQMRGIGSGAFADCSSMRRVTLPASISELPKDLFSENTKLKSVEFHGQDQLHTIRKNAFFRCQSLTSLVLPESVTTIDDRAFYRCKSLDHISLPGGDCPKTRMSFHQN